MLSNIPNKDLLPNSACFMKVFVEEFLTGIYSHVRISYTHDHYTCIFFVCAISCADYIWNQPYKTKNLPYVTSVLSLLLLHVFFSLPFIKLARRRDSIHYEENYCIFLTH